ncbi:MAG: alpha/beta hydrolase [Mycolicibacterium insubricum]|nr:alpha/beta hydrolase [Mycobacterium sp.]
MDLRRRGALIARELGSVLPRSARALAGENWSPTSGSGLRRLGEVALDELVLTGMTLTAPPPTVHSDLGAYPHIAAELGALGTAGCYRDPEPLRSTGTRLRNAGRLTFEQIRYVHDPRLPEALAAFGAPATAVVNVLRHPGGARPWLVWVHGAGQGNLSDFAVARVRRLHRDLGYNIAMPIQPGHGVRRRWAPTYPDTDPIANVAGMMRAVSETRAVLRWVAPQARTVALSGLSLGSGVAALAAGLEDGIDGVAVYTPIRGLNQMIAAHLHRWGGVADDVGALLNSAEVEALTAVIDPCSMTPRVSPERRLVVGAWSDRMAFRDPALALHERWGGRLYWHDGSHVGHLMSPRVQVVTEEFLTGLQ